MKKYFIAIDCGTTNTRATLFGRDKESLAAAQREMGVRNTAIDGDNKRLREAVRDCLDEVVEASSASWEQVEFVAASGMITSNVGLVEIPHLTAPAGIEELARGMREILLPQLCPLPIWFIPGVKNSLEHINLDNFSQMDIMRGEETECMAILGQDRPDEPALLILPGSHTKFVSVDGQGKITGGLTTISGELLSCITRNTIIADAVERSFVSEEDYDEAMVLAGFAAASREGLGRACFSCRILSQFVMKDGKKLANYILGAVLQDDLTAVKNSRAIRVDADTQIVAAGKNPLRRALLDVLKADRTFPKVREFVSENKLPLSEQGAFDIACRKFGMD